MTSLLAGGDATGFDATDDYASDDEVGGGNLQTATRAARVGSRVSRVLRAVRLLRVMRLTRYTRKKGSPDEIASEESELFRRFSELTARDVVRIHRRTPRRLWLNPPSPPRARLMKRG